MSTMVRLGKDPWLHIQQVAHYVRTYEYLDSVTQGEKSGVRKSSANFILEGDNIYYTGITTQKPDTLLRRLLIETEERMKSVLHEVHEASGHRGAGGTQERVVSQYYWLTITGDVKELVRNCHKCQLNRATVKRKPPKVLPIKSEGRWHVLECNLLGLKEPETPQQTTPSRTDSETKCSEALSNKLKEPEWRQPLSEKINEQENNTNTTSFKKRMSEVEKTQQAQIKRKNKRKLPVESCTKSVSNKKTCGDSEDIPYLAGALVQKVLRKLPQKVHLTTMAKLVDFLVKLEKECQSIDQECIANNV